MANIERNRLFETNGHSKETQSMLRSRGHQKLEINGQHQYQKEDLQFQPNRTLSIHLRAIRLILYIIFKVLNIAYVPLFIYRAFEKPKICQPLTNEILKIPASELTQKIRRKELSCEKVTQTYISRIKEVNPILNAVIEDRFAEAIEEAKKIDELISSENFLEDEDRFAKEYPLLGVPLTVKGSISVKGLKHTSGMVTRKVIAEDDAVTVRQARKAGAIPLLVSNVPELCMNWETTNKLIGTTKNPYDTTRTSGGSSGGEASLLAAGASLVGIGSDIAGSLRLPTHWCGVWGHKPTPGTVSCEGHYPGCTNHQRWSAAFTLGPMARYAWDLKTLLKVISVPGEREKLGLNEKIDVKKIKIYYTEYFDNILCDQVNEHCTRAVQKVTGHFTSLGNTPATKVDLHLLKYAPELATLFLIDIDGVQQLFDDDGTGAFAELLRYITFRSPHTLFAILYGCLRKCTKIIPRKYFETVENQLEILRSDFKSLLGKDGVFILPTFPTEAIKHGDALRNAFNSGYMSIFNALGFPVTNCPVGLCKNGLPVGVQVVGLPYCDKLTLAVAEEIEKAFGGWIPPKCT